MDKVKAAIIQLNEILDSLSDGDLMEVYGYLSGKMMHHLFGEELSDDELLDKALDHHFGASPFGAPVVKGGKKPQGNSGKKSIDPVDFMGRAFYDTSCNDVKCLTLRVELQEIEPTVWRELIVPSNLNLESLGHILVDAMDWEGYHLHQFIKGRDYYGIPDEEYGTENPFGGLFGFSPVKNHDSRDFTVGDVLARKRSWIDFEYDFGDSWMHRVTVVDSRKYNDGEEHKVVLVTGENACPPEDCGGVWGYYDMLDSLKKPHSKRAKEVKEWLGYDYDPTDFDFEGVAALIDDYNETDD